MKTPIRKSVPHFRIVSHISRLSANFRVSTFQVLVDPGRSWLALIGLGWSQDTWAWSWNALQHPETPWNTLKHLVQSCPEMWDTMDLNWCPTFQDLVYPMVYLCNNIPSPPGYHTSLFIPVPGQLSQSEVGVTGAAPAPPPPLILTLTLDLTHTPLT